MLSKLEPGYAWTFSRAFFPLSIGVERAGKLALQVNAKYSSGTFLTEEEMRSHGRRLDRLLDSVNTLNSRRGIDNPRPIETIHTSIVSVLTEFATNGRDHHLDNLAGRIGSVDPSKLWWDTVVVPVLSRHYKSPRRAADEAVAQGLGSQIDEFSVLNYNHVDGRSLSSMTDALLDGARLESATPWVRMYTLQIARWLATTMKQLSYQSQLQGDAEVPDLQEFFRTFNVDDSYMRTRKNWRPLS